MTFVMLAHGAGCALLGLVPALGLSIVAAPVRLVVAGVATPEATAAALEAPLALLRPVAFTGAIFVGVLGALVVLRALVVRASARHVTWGCGYTQVSPRMQYTGSSFSAQFREIFAAFLPLLTHEKLPQGPFPQTGEIKTHCVDAVERRMFKVLAEGDDTIAKAMTRVSDDARLSFAVGLIVLVAMIGIIAAGARP
jgi:hydrogenase-4 component B